MPLAKLDYRKRTFYNFYLTSPKFSCTITWVACLFHSVCSFLIISTLYCLCQCLCIRRKRFMFRLYPLPEETGGGGESEFHMTKDVLICNPVLLFLLNFIITPAFIRPKRRAYSRPEELPIEISAPLPKVKKLNTVQVVDNWAILIYMLQKKTVLQRTPLV